MMAGAVLPRVVILGGDAQAIELERMFRHFSTEVTLISRHDELVHHEDPEIGQLMTQHLHQQGVRVLLGRAVARAERADDDECAITLEDDTYARGRQVVVAGACMPRTEGLGIERVGARLGPRGVVVDEYCRAAEGVWAIGDVTGVSPLSHVAQYQARIVSDAILGHAHPVLPLTNGALEWNFAPLLVKAGLPAIRFHDLRHTAATLLLLRGIHPKVVSEMLGHSTISMTLDIYNHVLPDMQRDAIDALNLLLGDGQVEADHPDTAPEN